MAKITLNEALGWMKTLKARHAELVQLRNQNAQTRHVLYAAGQPVEKVEPLYDLKKIDKLIANVAKEIRLLDMAIKRTNAITQIAGYEQEDSILGEVE